MKSDRKGADMTIEEALHELKIQSQVLESMILYNKDFEPRNDNTSLENKKNAIDMAIESLEKQIPKKPKDYNEEDSSIDFVCPNCCEAVYKQPYKPKHCKHCGQRIDWRWKNE